MARQTGGREATTGVIEGQYVLGVGDPGTPTPEGWRWTALSDVARLESGHTPSRRKPEYWGGEIPWIGIKDATGNHGRTIYETAQYTNDLGIANSAARVLPANTVCLSRTASVGYVVVMGRPMSTSQDFANWVCTENLDYRFLKFALLAERDSFARFSYGSTHQTIYYPELKAFHICLPPIAEQKRIADILQMLDDKIELNRRMSATLEEMARALYRSWFVDFDPVHARALGQSPAHMDDTTAALFPDSFGPDGLPKDWAMQSLDDIADFLNGAALQKFPAEEGEDSLPVIKIAELRAGITPKSNRAGLQVPEKYKINDGDVLFSWSGSLLQKVWTEGPGALNQHLFKVTSKVVPKWLHFFAVDQHMAEFRQIAASKATTMGHIQRHHLKDAMIAIPDNRAVISAAGKYIEPAFNRAFAADLESKTLADLRDTLLPRLMSGELRVREVEKQVEEVL
ncbi:restriction endonuclease subunit S [Celeribacter persicus]|uniref:Type I restriction enzyme S subunit n=1 Tax=Celeribacter persicus TaxID=1651082 RepID=A0A2T5HMH1_9RHOB|nr:restriction endonuclease subunit S [Celeribacter persicus]PTQ72752.1 type I restriction enzyme S subunit [Celeribacter persicus]